MSADQKIAFATIAILLIGWGLVELHGYWQDRRAAWTAAAGVPLAESPSAVAMREEFAALKTVKFEPTDLGPFMRQTDRCVKEAIAASDTTPERITFEAPVIWHPSLGERVLEGKRVYNEEHPAITAERILRGQA